MFGGMLTTMDPASAREAAQYLVQLFRDETELSPIPWLGPAIADGWFALRDQEEQRRFLRRMVEADNDPDAWKALNLIAARLHQERRPFPNELADWASRLHWGGEIREPPKPQGNKGQPPYAFLRRNRRYGWMFFFLHQYLGLPRMECYRAIATECGVSERTVSDGIKAGRL